MPRRLTLALTLLALAAPGWAAQPQFWKIEGGRDFLDGDTDGLSIDSEGRLRLAPASHSLGDPEAPTVWSIAEGKGGVLYAGTGNDGKIFKIEGGKASVLFDTQEMEVHALAMGPDGKLYAATSPDGKVYAIDADGKAGTFYDPSEKYIWALAFDKAGNLLVGTGSEGRLYRVDRAGKAQLLLSGTETHITNVAVDAKGVVYAGSSPGGILYRIGTDGKVFVLYDSSYREVKALDLGEDGSVYLAVVEGKDREETSRPAASAPASTPVTTLPTAEVTVSETFTMPQAPLTPAAFPSPQAHPYTKGAVLRVLATGEVDTLWSSTEETPFSLLRTPEGLLMGTGSKGKLYLLHDDRTWTMVQTFAAEEITALLRSPRGTILTTANPGTLHLLETTPGLRGSFTSKVKDTDTVSTWGRVRWDALVPAGTELQIQSRSGNTTTPDSTWADWSGVYTRAQGDPITSAHARYIQLRAVLLGNKGATPILDTLAIAYLQRNLRPQIQSITVHAPGDVFQKPLSLSGEVEVLGLDPDQRLRTPPNPSLPPITSYSRKTVQRGMQTFSWRADDPNGDALVYDVSYRAVGDSRFRPLRKGLSDPVLAWDTSTVPNGRYLIRVSASDSPSNPERLALSAEKESVPFDVDNTPPVVTLERAGASVKVLVRDDSSAVRRTEYSIDGGRWLEVYPSDGINDAPEESYDIAIGELPKPGPHMLVVRSQDLLANQATARIEIP